MIIGQIPFYLISMVRVAAQKFCASNKPSELWACASCGCNIRALTPDADGTSWLVSLEISPTEKSSQRKHVLAVTSDGNVSISCEPWKSDGTASPEDGPSDSTSSTGPSRRTVGSRAMEIE